MPGKRQIGEMATPFKRRSVHESGFLVPTCRAGHDPGPVSASPGPFTSFVVGAAVPAAAPEPPGPTQKLSAGGTPAATMKHTAGEGPHFLLRFLRALCDRSSLGPRKLSTFLRVTGTKRLNISLVLRVAVRPDSHPQASARRAFESHGHSTKSALLNPCYA